MHTNLTNACPSVLVEFQLLTLNYFKMNNNETQSWDFSGAAILGNTKEAAIRRMKTGIATLVAIVVQASRSGAPTVKFVFDSLLGGGAGHDEYLRTSTAENLKQTLMKLRYAFVNSGNPAHRELIAKLPNPFTVIMVDGKPLVFLTNDELEAIKAKHGQNVDWIWAGRDSKERVAVLFENKEQYAQAFAACAEELKGQNYSLRIAQPKDGERFQKLESIEKAPVAKSKAA